MSNLHATILSLFPEMFPGPLQHSLAGKALGKHWSYEVVNIRDFGIGKSQQVDDSQYGGGSGLVIRADVLGSAIDSIISRFKPQEIYYMSPRGILFNQDFAHEVIAKKNILIICGRFEGIDERIIEEYNVVEISVGDFVLSGGEIAALVVLDTCIRLLPGVVKNQDSVLKDSFSKGTVYSLEYPLYTKPTIWRSREVPKVLLSGHHLQIKDWRLAQSTQVTKQRRPELIKNK